MTDETTELLTSVGRMYYLDDLSQHEIAEILGTSRSRVSRLLTAARERGIVQISVDEYEPRDRGLEQRLAERFELHHAIVVKTIGLASENVRRTVGYFAAAAAAELLKSNMTVGVAGGRTLRELINFMTPTDHAHSISVVQLMGNIDPNAGPIDALELSRALANRFNGSFYTLNAPAFVADRGMRDGLMAHEHIQQVWRLFDSLQLAFVGIGSLDDSAFVERGVLSPEELRQLRDEGAVGEICGRFFDRDGRECVTTYQDRVISIDLDVLRHRPEVVAVTNGANRASAISAALRGGLVSSLVIDDLGATALVEADKNVEATAIRQESALV